MKTSYYGNLKNINLNENVPVAISGDEGKIAKFNGRAMKKLSPYTFFRKWKKQKRTLKKVTKMAFLGHQHTK